MIAAKILCQGKVQGVFFRASTKEVADKLGIKGFVTNEPNGDVLIEALGNEDQLNQLISWCHQGSEFARVDRVEVDYRKLPERIPIDFTIQR